MNRLNIHIYPSQFKFESRILKITESLITHNIIDEVVIIALPGESLSEWEIIDDKRKVWRPSVYSFGLHKGTVYKLLFLIQYFFKVSKFALTNKVSLVNSHSITDLPVAYWIALLNRARLVYDTHELETERNGLTPISKKVYKRIEQALIYKADHIFVVSESIRQWYIDRYNLDNKKISTVKNIPKPFTAQPANNLFEEQLGISPSSIKFLYQGGLFYGRGIPMLLDAFSKVGPDKHLIIMGYGEYSDIVVAYSKKHANIHYVPAVPPSEVLYYSCSADVGIALIENICLSYYYCMPNKLYEYYLAGIPSIVSNFPDMKSFIQAEECGWAVEVDAAEFIKFINQLTMEDVSKIRTHIQRQPNKVSWLTEEDKLTAPYINLFKY